VQFEVKYYDTTSTALFAQDHFGLVIQSFVLPYEFLDWFFYFCEE
jgi:hypothetical protein